MLRFDFIFDRLSFFLGFLTATLFWWAFNRFRPYLPVYKERVVKYIKDLNQQNQVSIEQSMRKEVIRRSQRYHIAAPLFALDEIVVEPRLITPPPAQDPGAPPQEQTIAAQTLPYIPDWPELTCGLGIPTMPVVQSLQNGSHIAIIGQPGSGKSVALAYLASQLARMDERAGELRHALPLFIHIADLDTTVGPDVDPLQALIRAVSSHVNVVIQPQLSRYLTITFRSKSRKAVLLLDGLDELPAEELKTATAYLKALLRRMPDLQVITAASSDYLDGLVKLGFYPMGIAGWSHHQRREFISRWGDKWNTQLLPEIKKNIETQDVDPVLVTNWLIGDLSLENPLELTLKAWAAFAGDMDGPGLSQLLEAYFSRYMPGRNLLPSLDILAHQFVKQGKFWMDIDEMERILSGFQPPDAPSGLQADQQDNKETAAPVKKGKKLGQPNREAIVTQGERIISALSNFGVLAQHGGGRVRFSSPLFTGYLASSYVQPEEADAFVDRLGWTQCSQTLRFAAACAPNPAWISRIFEELHPPIYQNLLIAARWMADAPPNSEWRINLLRTMVGILQNDHIPIATRARMAGAFVAGRDPSTPKLFKQLLSSRSYFVRQIAVLGIGALGSPQYLNDILDMLGDPDPLVRNAACLAVSAVPGDTALSALVSILMEGDEDLRKAAAECLALNHIEGKQALEELSTVEDLLTRRAVVFGLVQIPQEWSKKILERIAVEDGQWVVRNAAIHALEEIQKHNIEAPRPLPAPSENAWLLTYASRMGLGIRPDQPATEVLVSALNHGSDEERAAAMQYLRAEPSETVSAAIYQCLFSDRESLQEPAMTALWMIVLSGFKLPNPSQYGMG